MRYSVPGCPVDKYDQEWIDHSLVWFEARLGKSFIKNREYLIPSSLSLEYHDFKSHEAIRYFIQFICRYIDMDEGSIEYTILWNADEDEEGLPDDFDVNTDYSESEPEEQPMLNSNGKYAVEIGEDMLDDFDGTFISLVYQITYISLYHKNVFSFYNAWAVNYAVVLLGFGVPAANAFVRSWQWGGLRYSAWRVKSHGVLNHRMYGYLFALLAKYRGRTDEPWLSCLIPDVMNFYSDAREFIEAGNTLSSLPAQAKDEEVFMEKYFHEGGSVSLISHVIENRMEGMASFFYENGMLWSERIYKNNIPYTVLSNFNPYDEPVEKGTLYKGNGTLYIYKPNGNLLEIETYKDGIKISTQRGD